MANFFGKYTSRTSNISRVPDLEEELGYVKPKAQAPSTAPAKMRTTAPASNTNFMQPLINALSNRRKQKQQPPMKTLPGASRG